MKNYFKFNDGEYISGWRYYFRQLLQSILILVYGFGLYLVAVTSYKRALSIGSSKNAAIFMAIANTIAPVILLAVNVLVQHTTPHPGVYVIGILANLVHWNLWFSDGKKEYLESQSTNA